MGDKQVPVHGIMRNFKDIGDGSYAEVVSLESSNVTLTGPVTVSNEVEIKNETGNPVPVSVAGLPATLGQKTKSASMAVVLPSDQDPLAVASTGGVVSIQAAQVVAIGAASAASLVVSAQTTRVILTATSDCWVTISATPVAAANTAGSIFLAAGVPSYPIAVTPGTTKVAVIQNSAAGYLSMVESA